MAQLQFKGVGIKAIQAAVPANKVINKDFTAFFDTESVAEIVEKTGIEERRFAPIGMCASDLCYEAADALLNELAIDRDEIDLLVFISQTPDYRMPATSIILQNRLGLPKTTAAFDISLGCSAFVYGLSVVYSMMAGGSFRKALLLDGETRSRVYHPKDRKTGFLFGDGGIAALIERDEKYGNSYFSLNSDGSKEDYIKIKAGGYRNPSTAETLAEREIDEHGNISTDEHGRMLGADVFNFVLLEIPKNINEILNFSGIQKENIDYFLFHQANAYMNSYLTKKLKVSEERAPQCLKWYGNTSSVSIPLTLCSQLTQEQLIGRKNLLLSGFGVGMSWASAVLESVNLRNLGVIEVEG
jgi:3-oxoacyl-[acyl-carrier-protein] synthase-3